LKYELKVALQQILSVKLNTEHAKHLQFTRSSSFRDGHFTCLFKMSWGKKPARNLPAAIQQVHGKYPGDAQPLPAPGQLHTSNTSIHNRSPQSSPTIISPLNLMGLQILTHFSVRVCLLLQGLGSPQI